MKTIKVALSFVIALCLGGAVFLYQFINEFSDTHRVLKDHRILIEPGTNLRSLLKNLEQQGVIDDAYFTEVYLKFANKTVFKAGEFDLSQGDSVDQFIGRLNSNSVVQYSFTIVEGDNIYEVAKRLKQTPHLKLDLSENVSEWKIQAHQGVSLEGRLFPDTYFYTRNTGASRILNRAYQRASSELTNAWQQNRNAQLKSPEQLLTLASIIEKETAVASERRLISSVFTNRLVKGMRLQTDPTVIYGQLPNFDGNITRAHLRDVNDYNTYVIKGLPKLPIANPGRASLLAAANPDESDMFYFVAKGDGSHQFSRTLSEHNKAVRFYQQTNRAKDYRSSPSKN